MTNVYTAGATAVADIVLATKTEIRQQVTRLPR